MSQSPSRCDFDHKSPCEWNEKDVNYKRHPGWKEKGRKGNQREYISAGHPSIWNKEEKKRKKDESRLERMMNALSRPGCFTIVACIFFTRPLRLPLPGLLRRTDAQTPRRPDHNGEMCNSETVCPPRPNHRLTPNRQHRIRNNNGQNQVDVDLLTAPNVITSGWKRTTRVRMDECNHTSCQVSERWKCFVAARMDCSLSTRFLAQHL